MVSLRRLGISDGATSRRKREFTVNAPTVRSCIDHSENGSVAMLCIDNRATLNVVDGKLVRQLSESLELLAADEEVRALVLRGAGTRAFIGGADIREMFRFNEESARSFITDLHGLCRRLRDCPVPTVARIDGYCLGAGMEIAACCDLRVASTRARFGMPEVRVGIPSVIEAALLPRLVGWGRARELLLTGDIIDAESAHAMGYIQRLVEPDDLDSATSVLVDSILAAGPSAVRAQKELLNLWEQLGLEEAIEAGIGFFADAYRTGEPRRMMGDFLDARAKAR